MNVARIDHRLCSHTKTAAARRVCRVAVVKRATEAQARAEAECGHLVGEQVLFYGLDFDGELDDLRHYGQVRGVTVERGYPRLRVFDAETFTEVVICPSEVEHVPACHAKYRSDLR